MISMAVYWGLLSCDPHSLFAHGPPEPGNPWQLRISMESSTMLERRFQGLAKRWRTAGVHLLGVSREYAVWG